MNMRITAHILQRMLILQIIMFTIQSIHLILLTIQLVEQKPEDNTDTERTRAETNEEPLDLRVTNERSERFTESVSEGVGEEVHGLHEGLHGWWGFHVCVFETSDGGEDFGDTDQHVCWCLDSDVDVVSDVRSVDDGGIAKRVSVTWPSFVDEVLQDCSVQHGHGGDDESE